MFSIYSYVHRGAMNLFFLLVFVLNRIVFTSVLPEGQPSGPVLVAFTAMNTTSFTWKVNVTEGM
jgi:hypothetical protein